MRVDAFEVTQQFDSGHAKHANVADDGIERDPVDGAHRFRDRLCADRLGARHRERRLEQGERVGIVFSKEVIDNLRDRRTVLMALLLPLLVGPGLFGALLLLIGRVAAEEAARTLDLPVAGAEHAPALVSYLEQNRVRVRAAPANPQAAVRLVFPYDGDDITQSMTCSSDSAFVCSRWSRAGQGVGPRRSSTSLLHQL